MVEKKRRQVLGVIDENQDKKRGIEGKGRI